MLGQWLKNEFPAVWVKATREKAEIWFADEAGVRSDAHAGITWRPKKKRQVVSSTGARLGLNIISTVSPQGNDSNCAMQSISSCRRLSNTQSDEAGEVSRHCARSLTAIFLPPYSPELNLHDLTIAANIDSCYV